MKMIKTQNISQRPASRAAGNYPCFCTSGPPHTQNLATLLPPGTRCASERHVQAALALSEIPVEQPRQENRELKIYKQK